jgi:hypothetical protein
LVAKRLASPRTRELLGKRNIVTRDRRQLLAVIAFAAVIGFAPTNALAQQTMRDVLSFLLTNQAVRTGDIEKDAEATAATRDTISRALLIELATLPISTSSSGFTYLFNSDLGTRERASSSFGPFFVERALTSGRNQMSFGATFRYSQFDRLDGNDLRTGDFVTTATQFRDEPTPFDVETLALRIDTRTVTAFANYGVSDRVDIGAALPIVSMRLAGERINTYRGQAIPQAAATATTTGVADMAITARAHLLGSRASGLSAGAELRLPTGREEDLLGTGEPAIRLLAIGSLEGERASAHLNGGYSWGGISREASYNAAVTVAASERFTLVGEFLGRWIEGLGQIRQVTAPHPSSIGVDTIRLLPTAAGVMTGMAVAGFKWNVGGRWLVNANVLLPVTDRGLRARAVPAIALDYSFGS